MNTLDMNPQWAHLSAQPRTSEDEITTPSLTEMAATPGATQTKYRVTFTRVGRRGGRDGSPAPGPLTVWAVTTDGLAEHIEESARPYLWSQDIEAVIDLERMVGQIYAGPNRGGSFSLAILQVVEGGAR